MLYRSLFRPLLFRMDPERSHDLAMELGQLVNEYPILQKIVGLLFSYTNDRLSQHLMGIRFPNPVGLAAGFDKNGHLVHAARSMGFGFIEVGSITAEANPGNKKPRLFRLTSDRSIINRMGLNNDGAETILTRLKKNKPDIPLGINIAKTNNADIMGDKAIEDYRYSYQLAKEAADYITLNVSCPNTGEGKTFEDPAALDELLHALNIENEAAAIKTLVKLSVDLTTKQMEDVVDICEQHRISGYVVANTSADRDDLHTPGNRLQQIGSGGLSGRAIAHRSTEMIRNLSDMIEDQKPIIGVGGVESFQTALDKFQAGACLVQVYTGLIYEGPGLIRRINRQLVQYLEEHQLNSISQIYYS